MASFVEVVILESNSGIIHLRFALSAVLPEYFC